MTFHIFIKYIVDLVQVQFLFIFMTDPGRYGWNW